MEEEEGKEEEEEHALTLFDFYWFHHQILRSPPPPPPPLPLRDLNRSEPESCNPDPPPPEPRLHARRRRRRRSLSDYPAPISAAHRTHHPQKLETILSGQEEAMREEIARRDEATVNISEIERRGNVWARRRKKGISKSLSDLEFEELKGFMDLGFTFSGAEADPRLMSIVPGLQRLGIGAAGGGDAAAGGADESAAGVSRPYLSEAWEEPQEERLLTNWRITAAGKGADMKHQLRSWAHAVASTVW